jgi:hypothetical protein
MSGEGISPDSRVLSQVEPTSGCKGKGLQPGSAGVTRSALNFYKASDPDFTGEYFPNVMARGYAMYGDVFAMDDRQVAALVPIMDDSIRRF